MGNRQNIYLINPIADHFRWAAIVEDEDDWGIQVSRIKDVAVGANYGPVPIEWIPETIDRRIADFPNFRTNLLCVSACAKSNLEHLFADCGEWIALSGLSNHFSAFHCLQIADALDRRRTDELLRTSIYKSFHSPRFVPALQEQEVPRAQIFKVPESKSKLFVSGDFKISYEKLGLSGLEFFDVELCG